MVLATIAVLLRMIARWVSATKYGVDDLLVVLALIIAYGMDIMYLASVPTGLGRHMIMISLPAVESFTKSYFSAQILFACSITLTKLSLLFFYHRIFPIRKFVIISTITGCVMVAWCISLIFAVVFSCHPVAFFWDKTIKGGSCINENNLAYGITATNIVTDIIVLILPIPWLWNLQMPMARKLAIIGIFLLGSFVCIAGIIRIPLLTELKVTDVTWTSVAPGLWILVECNVGILSCCLPTLRPLFKTTMFSKISSRFSNMGKGSQGSGRPSDEEQPSTGSMGYTDRRTYPDEHQPAPAIYHELDGTRHDIRSPQTRVPRTDTINRAHNQEVIAEREIAVRRDVRWELKSGNH